MDTSFQLAIEGGNATLQFAHTNTTPFAFLLDHFYFQRMQFQNLLQHACNLSPEQEFYFHSIPYLLGHKTPNRYDMTFLSASLSFASLGLGY